MIPEQKNPYAGILTLPHQKAENHPHMSMRDRAAQFSPFAVFTGFDAVITEIIRMTGVRIELSKSQNLLLNQKLSLIDEVIQNGYPHGDSGILPAGRAERRQIMPKVHREGAVG